MVSWLIPGLLAQLQYAFEYGRTTIDDEDDSGESAHTYQRQARARKLQYAVQY
jgi:hypothetical protein